MIDALAPYLPAFLAAYAVQTVGALSPGPAVALLLGTGADQGRRAALAVTAGIALGSGILALGTALGLGLLLERVAWSGTALRYLGAGYLAWLALKAWRKALHPPRIAVATVRRRPTARLFLTGLILPLTNVSAMVFWLAAVSVGPAQVAPFWVHLLFGLGGATILETIHGAYAVMLSSRLVRQAYNGARRWIEGLLGTVLAFMAFRIAMERA
ncbi:LysE family translocator [Paracoccus sp. S3-43]|uniref:LysE family translocator n=1 Tax=Paracoccus sp. S3-43 TaxID=3030011 RepID=UPI0023B1D37A|nr:LysE family translocator [Paracoccus sp. S3-43]WEF24998.1 LysE family translocator [Paracoccus sp. S3-43]